ncbi:MAG: nucleoside hydrolase [Clostridiales bacterium]|nr:nucleoside hydrolase [Clostridiales bacterium]
MPYRFTVQEKKRRRVIIDTDAACEADDPYAIAHGLMTPRFIVKGILAEQFNQPGSVQKSYDAIKHLLDLMDIHDVPVLMGTDPLTSETDAPPCEAADFIIREALKDDPHPLYVLCQGALSNVAAAINKCPEIQDRFICIWIGGGFYPRGGWEFNSVNDYHAANAVFSSRVEVWQVPMSVYTKMQLGYAELEYKVRPCGKVGEYLFEQMIEHGMHADWVEGESWAIGDQPAIGLALNPGCGRYRMQSAPRFGEGGVYVDCPENRQIRVYEGIDQRYILEDFFCKLALNYRQ